MSPKRTKTASERSQLASLSLSAIALRLSIGAVALTSVAAAAFGVGALAQTAPQVPSYVGSADPVGVYATPAPIPPPSTDGSLRANAPFFLSPAEPVFRQKCAGCHTEKGGIQGGNGVIPSRGSLASMAPASVVAALSPGGAMASIASFMTARDRVTMAEYITNKKLEKPGVPEVLTNICKTNPALAADAGGTWNGWSSKSDNARFQTAAAAGITAADVPKLKLKWAFGIPGGGAVRSQPTVSHGRVFVGGDTGRIYAIDAKSGCTYWSFKMDAPGRLAPIVAPVTGRKGVTHAVYLVDGNGGVYGVDAHDGKQLWAMHIGEGAKVSPAASIYKNKLFVSLNGSETISGDDPNYECCKTRGGLAAVDVNTGKLLWRVSTIPEPLEKQGVNSYGKTMWGPSGASVWNPPTVDGKRNTVYVGTGNNFGLIANGTSDAIIAYSMTDGKMLWVHQEFKGDSFMARCPFKAAPGGNCPAIRGPDADFGGGPVILHTVSGKDTLLAAGKGGVAIALDPDQKGKVLWRHQLWEKTPPPSRGLVLFGGAADANRVYYPLQRIGGGLAALNIKDGSLAWTADVKADSRGQGSAPSMIPGAVFTGGWDGILRAVDTSGKVIWTYNTHRDYDAVNGVPTNGGSMGSAGPAIVDGMMYVGSGYVGASDGFAGNVILAFSAK